MYSFITSSPLHGLTTCIIHAVCLTLQPLNTIMPHTAHRHPASLVKRLPTSPPKPMVSMNQHKTTTTIINPYVFTRLSSNHKHLRQ